MKAYSWEILNEKIAIKNMNKSAFKHRGTGIPKEIRYFFDMNKMKKGDRRIVFLEYKKKNYKAKLEMGRTRSFHGKKVSEEARMFWFNDFEKRIKQRFPERFKAHQENEKIDTKYELSLRFEKDSVKKDLYHISFISTLFPRAIEISPTAIDIDEPKLPHRSTLQITRIIRDTKITRELKILYDNTCQICGKSILLRDRKYSEAHHLRPLGQEHNGSDTKGNIIILCPNHHVEFDYCIIAIDSKSMKIIHMDSGNQWHNKTIYVHSKHQLDRKNIEYHYQRYVK